MNRLRYIGTLKNILIGILLAGWLPAHAQDTSFVAIGNLKGVPSEMKMTELRSVMRGERQRWPDGTKVVIAMIKSTSPMGNAISEKIYSMSGDEVRGFWAGISFAGKFDPPNVFNTSAEVESFVAQNPGAIAVLDKSSGSPEIKTILVGGKKSF